MDGYLSEASVTLLIQNLFNNYEGPTIIFFFEKFPPTLPALFLYLQLLRRYLCVKVC